MNRLMKSLALAMALIMVIVLIPIPASAATDFGVDLNKYTVPTDGSNHTVTFDFGLTYNAKQISSIPDTIYQNSFTITAMEPSSSNLFSAILGNAVQQGYSGSCKFTFQTKGDAFNGTYTWPFVISYNLKADGELTDTIYPSFTITNGQDVIDGPGVGDGSTTDPDKSTMQSIYDITLRPTAIAKDSSSHKVDLELHLAYQGSKNFQSAPLSYFRIEPVVSGVTTEFPFELEYSSYGKTMADIVVKKNSSGEVTDTYFEFPFKVKSDAVNGYYPVTFKLYHLYQYTNLQETAPVETTITTYVEIRNGKKASSGSSTDPSVNPSTAILLLDGYTLNPTEISAGDEFDLTLRIRNTSDKAVSDVKSTLKEANDTIVPVNGTNSFFIEKIGAGEIEEYTMRVKATATAGVLPLSLTLSNEFVQDKTGKTSTDTFTVPVKQVSNLSLDAPNYPIEVYMGDSFNLMMSLYNKGKSTLYNVSVYLDSEFLKADENYYAGNMDSGANKSYDVMVSPTEMASGQVEGDIVVSFEDAEGNVTEKRTPITVNVASMDYGYEDPGMEIGGDYIDTGMEPMEGGGGFPTWAWILVGVVVVGAGIVVIVIVRKRKKAKVEDDEMD